MSALASFVAGLAAGYAIAIPLGPIALLIILASLGSVLRGRSTTRLRAGTATVSGAIMVAFAAKIACDAARG